ncbi:MAG TPA: hypothetical protein VMW24_06070 [Sedimentisphaerales bacterium]|nr:hypothetical protein [Sedimentisphaerales bacterium]
MAKKNLENALNVEIPEALASELDEVAVRLGLIKKRAVAAALAHFLAATVDDKMQMYQAVYEGYYATGDELSGAAGFEPQTEVGRRAAEKLAGHRGKKGAAG